MKKRVVAIVATAAVLISLLTGVVWAASRAADFTDVPESHRYYRPIDCVVRRDVMNGVTDELFSPDTTATYGMLYTVMARVHGVEADGPSWHETGMEWAVEWGLTDGGEDPDDLLTLEETLTVLWKYMRCPHRTAPLAEWYSDSGQISDWAWDAMNWAVRDGIISNDTNILDPQRPVTRGELAYLICRIWDLCSQQNPAPDGGGLQPQPCSCNHAANFTCEADCLCDQDTSACGPGSPCPTP